MREREREREQSEREWVDSERERERKGQRMGGGRDINDVYLQDAMLAANFEPEIEDGIAAM